MLHEHRRREEERARRLQREIERRGELRAPLKGTIWHTRDGEEIPVEQMTPRHAQNSIRFARNMAVQYELLQAGGDPFGASDWERGVEHAPFGGWPLIKALQERAAEKPSLRDRWVDRRNRKAWGKRCRA